MSTSSDSLDSSTPGREERLGDRLNRKMSEQKLLEAFEAAGGDGPLSIGLLAIEADLSTEGVATIAGLVAARINGQLQHRARLVSSAGPRFLIALPGQPLLEALLSIDRLRDALEREAWPLEGEAIRLAFGAGVATQRSDGEPIAETLTAAERSLAQARRLVVRRHAAESPEAPASAPASLDASAWPTRHTSR